MPFVEVSIAVRVNGVPIATAPFTYSFYQAEFDEVAYLKSGNDGTSYFSFGRLPTQTGFLLSTDTKILLGFLGQSTGLELDAGGLILLLGGTLSAGANSNLMVNNTSGSNANIKGWEFGP